MVLAGAVVGVLVANNQELRKIELFKAVNEGVTKNIQDVQKAVVTEKSEWITIPPRSKEECIKESGGELNNYFVRCRNGRQELVKVSESGRKTVLSERPIPSNISR